MSRFRNKPFERRWDRWLVRGFSFVAVFAYVYFIIRPHLLYDAFGIYLPYPEFSLDWTRFRQALPQAGGPAQYVSAFLSQWFYYSCAGALIITAVAWLICVATNRLIRRMGETSWWFLSLFPACAVLILYQTYHNPLAALVALAICLWLAVAFEIIPMHQKAIVGTVAFIILCVGLYYLAGAVSLLLGFLVGTWYACAKHRIIQGGGIILASAIVPWVVGTRWFYMTIGEAYSLTWPFGAGSASDMEALPLYVLRGLFLFPLLAVLAVASWHVLSRAVKARWPVAARAEKSRFTGSTLCRGRVFRVAVEVLVLGAAVTAIHYAFRTPNRQKRFEMVHFTRDRQWDQVLHAARQVPGSSRDLFYSHLVNRSLYHTGRLGDDMFSFYQHPAGLLLLADDVPGVPPKFWMVSEIALELGDINLAEQWAYQTLEGVGDCPSALETLALVCAAKKQNEAACVLLRRMRKDVIYGRRASRLLGLIEQTPKAEDDWLVQVERLRSFKPSEDYTFRYVYSEHVMLDNLLKANNRNKMAFEYLMAFYLLAKRPDKIVENLRRLDDFGCHEIPRHYEEAILIHTDVTGQEVPLGERRITPQTIERFNDFVNRCRPRQNQGQVDMVALARDFGDSYWFYFVFGRSAAGGSP